MKASTGLRNGMLDTNDLKTILALGQIEIYRGTVPADADAAIVPGDLLVTITEISGATGLSFAASAVDGVISKDATVWSGVVAITDTATFYRHVGAADTGVLSTTEPRIQGTIGLAGADLNLTDLALIAAATQTIDFYVVALPTL